MRKQDVKEGEEDLLKVSPTLEQGNMRGTRKVNGELRVRATRLLFKNEEARIKRLGET